MPSKKDSTEESGGTARLEVFRSGRGFILKVGPVFLALSHEAAEEMMCLLAEALEPTGPLPWTTAN